MKVVAIILTIITICVGGFYLLGALFYWLSIKRNNVIGKRVQKEVRRMIKKYKISFSWWKSIPNEIITFESKDKLKLYAHILQHPKKSSKKKIAIIVHGYMADYREMQHYAKMFYNNGFTVVCPENRGHGRSEGEGVGMGWLDKNDITKLISVVNSKYKNAKIVLFGLSMGGATVCMTSGEDLPSNIKCIVSDCAYSNVYDEFKFVASTEIKIPEFPFMFIYNQYYKDRLGFSLKEADTVSCIQRCKKPILFIHGENDTFVPTKMVYTLYNNAPEELRHIKTFPNAGHAESEPLYPNEYEQCVMEFVNKFLK